MIEFNDELSQWDTSQVTSMSWMFTNALVFNGNLSLWNTSQVCNMRNMFSGASELTVICRIGIQVKF